jgi:hypothetical protein
MFNASRYRVMTSSKEGKTEKLRGLVVYMPTMRIMMAMVMLKVSRMSRAKVGNGTRIMTKTARTPMPMNMSLTNLSEALNGKTSVLAMLCAP